MKKIIIFIFIFSIRLHALDFVKCGSVKLTEPIHEREISNVIVEKSRSDGTTLFCFSNTFRKAIVKPFTFALISKLGTEIVSPTEKTLVAESTIDGFNVKTYNELTKHSLLSSDFDVIFASINDFGYLDVQKIGENTVLSEYYVTNNILKSVPKFTYQPVIEKWYIVKYSYTNGVTSKIDITDRNIIKSTLKPSILSLQYNIQRKIIFPKVNGDNLDFYLVVDDDIYPSTKILSESNSENKMTLTVNTVEDDTLQIQSSSNLKDWKPVIHLDTTFIKKIEVPINKTQSYFRAAE